MGLALLMGAAAYVSDGICPECRATVVERDLAQWRRR
jgi:hypothetical protein